MVEQTVEARYLDIDKLKSKLAKKFPKTKDFRVKTVDRQTSWDTGDKEPELPEDDIALHDKEVAQLSMSTQTASSQARASPTPSWKGSISSATAAFHLDDKIQTLTRWRTFEPELTRDVIKVMTAWQKDELLSGYGVRTEFLNKRSDLRTLQGVQSNESGQAYLARLICIHGDHSWRPLNISDAILRALIEEHDVSLDFLQLVSHFYQRIVNVEEANYVPFISHKSNGYHESMYILKYPELNGRKDGAPWSLRRLAFYHQLRISDNRSTYILISPKEDSQAERDLSTWFVQMESAARCRQEAFLPHEILTSRPMDNWRKNLMDYERNLEKMSLRMLGEEGKRQTATSEDMANIHLYESLLIPLESAFSSTKQILDGLSNVFSSWKQQPDSESGEAVFISPGVHNWEETLYDRRRQIQAYEEYAQAIWRKCASISTLHNGLLNLRNQLAIQDQSDYALDLGTSTVVITGIFLAYLSFTAVATIFAMPFFKINWDNGHVKVSSTLWIFFAASVPLTVLSIVYWRFRMWRNRKAVRRWWSDTSASLV